MLFSVTFDRISCTSLVTQVSVYPTFHRCCEVVYFNRFQIRIIPVSKYLMHGKQVLQPEDSVDTSIQKAIHLMRAADAIVILAGRVFRS